MSSSSLPYQYFQSSSAPHGQQQPIVAPQLKQMLEGFVRRYDEDAFQQCLRRMENDCRQYVSLEAWAQATVSAAKHAAQQQQQRGSTAAMMMSSSLSHENLSIPEAHATCLQLIYDMMRPVREVDDAEAWEDAIARVFKVRRLERILAFCLPLEHARISLGGGTADWTTVPQHHSYNTNSNNNIRTMDPRLVRLLYSPKLCLQKNAMFAAWSRPQQRTSSAVSASTVAVY